MADYDAIVIGTGQAGPSLALRLASAGMKVAVAERNLVGGTCVNTGCTPTKALVASAYAAHTARRAAEYGDRPRRSMIRASTWSRSRRARTRSSPNRATA